MSDRTSCSESCVIATREHDGNFTDLLACLEYVVPAHIQGLSMVDFCGDEEETKEAFTLGKQSGLCEGGVSGLGTDGLACVRPLLADGYPLRAGGQLNVATVSHSS